MENALYSYISSHYYHSKVKGYLQQTRCEASLYRLSIGCIFEYAAPAHIGNYPLLQVSIIPLSFASIST